MRVHAFGNSPSPAIATYALQKTAEIAQQTYGKDVQDFVEISMLMMPSHQSAMRVKQLTC